jgi:DNA polymerase
MPVTYPTAAPFLPVDRSLESLREAAAGCQGCDLYKNATQTVFGLGPPRARVMLVGEQPGDREDREGLPFVGPAGRVLGKALDEVGLQRGRLYITNAVKHFKWTPNGSRRGHVAPNASEVHACLPWLEAETEAVQPDLIVCLGSTAVHALLGSGAKVMKDRGRIIETTHGPCLVTVHPSSLLRVEDRARRQEAYDRFLRDLRGGIKFLEQAAV